MSLDPDLLGQLQLLVAYSADMKPPMLLLLALKGKISRLTPSFNRRT